MYVSIFASKHVLCFKLYHTVIVKIIRPAMEPWMTLKTFIVKCDYARHSSSIT